MWTVCIPLCLGLTLLFGTYPPIFNAPASHHLPRKTPSRWFIRQTPQNSSPCPPPLLFSLLNKVRRRRRRRRRGAGGVCHLAVVVETLQSPSRFKWIWICVRACVFLCLLVWKIYCGWELKMSSFGARKCLWVSNCVLVCTVQCLCNDVCVCYMCEHVLLWILWIYTWLNVKSTRFASEADWEYSICSRWLDSCTSYWAISRYLERRTVTPQKPGLTPINILRISVYLLYIQHINPVFTVLSL